MKIDRTEWYHVNIDGRDIGWFDSRSISTYSFERNGVYHVATNDTSHGVWSKPYGVKNAAWIDSAVAYKNKKLVLKMYIHLGDTYWYAFDNGHGGVFWIDKDVVRIGEAK